MMKIAAYRRRRKLNRPIIVIFSLLICAIVVVIIIGISSLVIKDNKDASSPGQSTAGSSALTSMKASSSSSSLSASTIETGVGSLLMLVNKDHFIPSGYAPQLTTLPLKYYYSQDKDNSVDVRAASYLQKILDDASNANISLKIYSGHRTYDYQKNNYQNKVSQYLSQGYSSANAVSAAAQLVAPPGTSEHETGLAFDIVSSDWLNKHTDLTEDFDQTDEFAWLRDNAANYGFILRYLKDKTSITGYSYEPWHYRFVGMDNAKKIKQSGLCLEEYLNTLGSGGK